MTISVRLAAAEDVGTVHAMIRELAAFEGGAVKSTEADLLRDGFGEHPLFEVLLAERDDDVVGMLVFLPVYSTWEGRPGLMIHDLYVREAGRGAGAGKALVRAVARLTLERGGTRLDVNVLDWNDKARRFYDAAGLTLDEGWLRHRASREALARLAAGS